MLGAGRVIAIDREPERLLMAARHGHAETSSTLDAVDVFEELKDMTGGRGSGRLHRRRRARSARHGASDAWYDKVKTATLLATDRPSALRQAIHACRKGGTVSIPGVYGGFLDKVPIGAAFGKGLTLKMGQTHVHRYLATLLDRIERGEIDPSFVITHRSAWTTRRRPTRRSAEAGRLHQGRDEAVASGWSANLVESSASWTTRPLRLQTSKKLTSGSTFRRDRSGPSCHRC